MKSGLRYRLAREVLFRFDAEAVHELTLRSFRRLPRLSTAAFASPPVDDPFDWQGLRFRNRVGLAAGLDKNGECLEAWERLGFGFVEIGTVTPRPQPGNPRPRMFRLPDHEALINRLGFNNKGVDHLLAQVRAARFSGVLGINIGKNADTPLDRAAEDYLACLDKVYPHASYVTVNISSPNTRGLRDLQDEARLDALLAALAQRREVLMQEHGRRVPLLIKIAPDVAHEQLAGIAAAVQRHGIDGLIATNTTITRPGLDGVSGAQETGGLSGRPLRVLADAALRRLRAEAGPGLLLIGVGGVMDAADARARREAGADLVQIYTGFIYRGPALIADCARALKADA